MANFNICVSAKHTRNQPLLVKRKKRLPNVAGRKSYNQKSCQPSSTNAVYLEFRLPSGVGGMAAGYTSQAIIRRITAWTDQTGFTFQTKFGKYRLWIIFDDPVAYTAFGISWQPWSVYSVPEFIDKTLDL